MSIPAPKHEQTPLADLIATSYALERSGDISAAFRQAREALEWARSSGGPEEIAEAQVCVAHCQQHLGHYQQAWILAEKVLAGSNPDSCTRADALRIMGNCRHEAGDLSAAEELYRRAIDIARQIGYHQALQSCLHSLSACVYIPRGQFELALAADEESLRLALELNMPEIAWFPLLTMGWISWVTGQRKRALAIVDEMRGYVQPGSMAEGYYECLRADLALEGDTPDSALPLYTRARAIAEIIGDPGLNAELRLGLSRYYLTAGNAPAAHDWADEAFTIVQRSGNRDLQGCALIEHGRAAWQIGNFSQAETDFTTAIKVLTSMQAYFDLARAKFLLAALYHEQGHSRAAEAWLEAITSIVNGGFAFLLERERTLAFPLLADYLNRDDLQIATLSNRLVDHLSRVPPPPLRIYTLGRFDVRQGKRNIPEQVWRQRRAGELFRLLLVSSNRSTLRDEVIQAIWPDKPPDSVQSLFHQATSALRRALEPDLPDKFPSRYLCVERGQISLQLPTGSWVDFEAFEAHIENRSWEAALECYRGNLFPGDLYSDWAAGPRERLKQLALRAAIAAARNALEAQRPDQVLNVCRRALALEPWQEEVVLLGMKACVMLNDRAGAIRLYQRLEHSLRDELDVAPQQQLQQLYRSLIST